LADGAHRGEFHAGQIVDTTATADQSCQVPHHDPETALRLFAARFPPGPHPGRSAVGAHGLATKGGSAFCGLPVRIDQGSHSCHPEDEGGSQNAGE